MAQIVFQPGAEQYKAIDGKGNEISIYRSDSEKIDWKRLSQLCVCKECNVICKTIAEIDPSKLCLLILFSLFMIIFLNMIGFFILMMVYTTATDFFPTIHKCACCGVKIGTTKKSK